MRQRYSAILLICLLNASLSGCGRASTMAVHLSTANHLNPDENGVNKPVVITIFQLTQPMPFNALTYNQLTNNDIQALGSTLIDYKTIEIRPKSNMTIILPIYKTTKSIGLIAAFHHIGSSHWRTLVSLPNKFHKIKLRVNLGINRIDASYHQERI